MDKKRKIPENNDKIYRFQVLLPNGLKIQLIRRNPIKDNVSFGAFIEIIKGKYSNILKENNNNNNNNNISNVDSCVNYKRKITWTSNELFLEDSFGNKIIGDLYFSKFEPNKTHFLKLFDGSGETVNSSKDAAGEIVNSSEEMWDLTPDTDLLSELPDDYTFETALADLIDNSLQAVWSNKDDERKLISIEIDKNRISVFDTGPGMDGSVENSIAKWGKMGASLHRSSKKLAIGGDCEPPFLMPYFGMFGYGGTIASMHLGRYAVVSAKTKESEKVYWLRLERDALLKRAGSSSNWKAPGGVRDPSADEMEMSEHGSFLKIDMAPKLKVPDLFQLQCKLKDIYFPYIQCDEIAGKTETLVEFEVNEVNLTEIDGGEVAVTNLHSCNGPEFVLDIHFSTEVDKDAAKRQSKKEANARLKCVYFPIVEGKENIDRILERLNDDGCGMKENFQTFSRISIRRLGRLLPDARWDLLPFMKPKHKRGDKLQVLKRCCLRVKCFIETDAGFTPIPSKTDLALHHPFTKALKELGDASLKGVNLRILRGRKQLSLSQLEREYQNWVLQMHSEYDEELSCGDDEPTVLVNGTNKEELGITSDVLRVHQAVTLKGKSWNRGQKIKILKGAFTGCHKNNYATIEYFLLENLQGDAGGEVRIICRPKEVHDQDGAKLTDNGLELNSSISVPIMVIDSGKCVAISDDEWNSQAEKLNLKSPSSIEVLGLKQCKALNIDGALPSGAIFSAGLIPPKEVVAILRPSYFPLGNIGDLDQKYIVKENYEMCMDVTFKAEGVELSEFDNIFSANITNTSRKGCQGLYIFPLSSIPHLFEKAGVYSFSFSLKKSACASCEISVQIKASSDVESWKILQDDDSLPFDVSVGSFFPPFSIARYDKYENCVAFTSAPDILFKLMSDDEAVLSPVKSAKVEMSSDQLSIVVTNIRVMTDNLDKIRPSYDASLDLLERDKSSILSIPCRVLPGAPKSITLHLPKSSFRCLPRQVVEDIKLEIFDRHNNHVKQGEEVELKVHGFCFQDKLGNLRKVDNQGFVDLSGVLKVSEGYGKLVSFSVLFNKQLLLFKRFQVENRELRMATVVPDVCQAGSKLKDIAFEVVDPEGDVDQTIHDNEKCGLPHTLKIRTGSTENDSLRYVFQEGRCVVPCITLPKRPGDLFIETVHSQHPELRLKFKIAVSQQTDVVFDITSDHQALEETGDGLCRFSDESITPDPISPVTADIANRTRNQFHDKKVNIRQLKQDCAFSSPYRTPEPEHAPEQFDGNFMDHPSFISLENEPTLSDIVLIEEQPNLAQTSKQHRNSHDKYENHIFQSQESKATCADPFTPTSVSRLFVPDLVDLQDIEKDILLHGSQIKSHEDKLRYFELRKSVIEDLVCKDREELLLLQASMEPMPLDVVEKIENKVESAAALYSMVSRDTSLRDRHSLFMDDVVGLVALIGIAPSHKLSRSLAEYLGEEQMLAVVFKSNAAMTTPKKYEVELNSLASELGTRITGSHLFICLDDIRAYPGGFVEGDSQKRLALPEPISPDGETPPGFLGFAVNMIDICDKHLQTTTSAGFGLRETLFYRLLGDLQVYETKEDMNQAYWSGCANNGALSLDGGIMRGNGMILYGCKELDVHFPVFSEQNQVVKYSETSRTVEEMESMAKKKQQQIEDSKAELILVEGSIAYISQQRIEELQQFKEKEETYQKLLEVKKASFSQLSS